MPDAYDNCKLIIIIRPTSIVIIHCLESKRLSQMAQRKITDKPFILGTDNFKCKRDLFSNLILNREILGLFP